MPLQFFRNAVGQNCIYAWDLRHSSMSACFPSRLRVTHLDSVRQVVTWARHNMEISSLDGIRWTIDDALKYVTRQVRRGASFDGIILDPPAYGRGPDGERWKLDECLNDILRRTSGELVLRDDFGRILPLSVYTRLER